MAADTHAELTGDPSPKAASGTRISTSAPKLGLILGALAVVFWSFGASLVFVGAEQTGTWPFVTISSLTGGFIQLMARRVYHGELRTSLRLPWQLWLGPVVCFVLYGLAWPFALVNSTTRQVVGVSLINYLWPVLTVLFSVWLVPGVRLTPRTLIAVILAGAGLVLANYKQLEALVFDSSNHQSAVRHYLPYILGGIAAVTWAIYSALLARWRAWAKDYVTSPSGFLLIGLIGAALMTVGGTLPKSLTPLGALLTLCYGCGPLAAGYLLWEVALSKAKVQTLSLIAAVTPILSTFLLCFFLRRIPGAELICAAFLVSGGVVLSMRD